MRASTIFALTMAILLGLGVAVTAKLTGYFTQEPAPKQADIQILVAARNLFAGDVIDTTGVRVRSLLPTEMEMYQKYKDQFLPAIVNAANLRVPTRNIEADQPILRSYLKDMSKPEPLNARLLPDMRAINLSLSKDHSAGGLVQVGDWVDVLLTSKVDGHGSSSTRTACLIPRVRVIAKRNTLWPVYAPLPDNKPVQFTLEVNAYRAALMEFARNKGDVTLAPLPWSEQKKLEDRRDNAIRQVSFVKAPGHFLELNSTDAEEEDQRIMAYHKGELTISEADLVRIFGLKAFTTPPPLQTTEVQRIVGVKLFEPARFNHESMPIMTRPGNPTASPANGHLNSRPSPSMSGGFQFNSPSCATCGNKNKVN
jgi:Flp pilus assembly protein CpaB